MRIVIGALVTDGTPFSDFATIIARIQADDMKALSKVLWSVAQAGQADAAYSNGRLYLKATSQGLLALKENERNGSYAISFDQLDKETLCLDPNIQVEVFHRAFRRLLEASGFLSRQSKGGSTQRIAQPKHDSEKVADLVIARQSTYLFMQGFRYKLEVRRDGRALLWLDPLMSVYDKDTDMFLHHGRIIRAGLTDYLHKLSVVSPKERLSRMRNLIGHISSADGLNVVFADGSGIRFLLDPVEIGTVNT